MKWKALFTAAILQAQLPITEAQSFGLLDPKLCYLLDGILFIYGVILTALFLRVKRRKNPQEGLYNVSRGDLTFDLGKLEEGLEEGSRGRAGGRAGGGLRRKGWRRAPEEGLEEGLEEGSRGRRLLLTLWSLSVQTFPSWIE
ncbi:T-cell surface glycoprotein CD3 zeta chain isoform X11 [Pan troglodytes]|uniref:T-cell surface glycoprotein CD3 zeta chain isoform X11 n=1 Tax=Pan troglodytes TaxID=9598 RepID=UPI0007DBA54C|nr:T-cell surface glycoprotein CD3 zeta chain isoform X9 [Pan troglodytes]